MSKYVKVSTRQIDRDKERISNELEGIRNSVEELYQEMGLLGQTWEGPAWQTFQSQMVADVENMRDIHNKLAEYIRHMEYAANEYRACESKMEQMINSIRI